MYQIEVVLISCEEEGSGGRNIDLTQDNLTLACQLLISVGVDKIQTRMVTFS